MALVLLRVAGNMAKRLENQGNKGYSLGIWSWRQLLEGAESPNTAGFPRLVEQARWGAKGSWEVSPAGLLCSVLGLFCVYVFQAWRWDCVASQASPEISCLEWPYFRIAELPQAKDGRFGLDRKRTQAHTWERLQSAAPAHSQASQPANLATDRNKPTC